MDCGKIITMNSDIMIDNDLRTLYYCMLVFKYDVVQCAQWPFNSDIKCGAVITLEKNGFWQRKVLLAQGK